MLKTFLFSRAFCLSSLYSVAHCLAPATLKLRTYGSIQIHNSFFHAIMPSYINVPYQQHHQFSVFFSENDPTRGVFCDNSVTFTYIKTATARNPFASKQQKKNGKNKL